MGLFDFMKKQNNVAPASTPAPSGNDPFAKKISLRKEIVSEEVKMQNISVNISRVVFVLDHSGSMLSMYKNGTIQNVLERIFPIAMHFDDNGEMEFYWFDSKYKELPSVSMSNIRNYVQNVIMSSKDSFGGTNYAPVMKEVFDRYAKRDPMNIPTFVIFITDGNNADKSQTEAVLKDSSRYNIFWKFVGIGSAKFAFLEKLDDLSGRFIDNANFISVNDIDKIDDRELYSKLLTEYEDWLTLCRKNGIPVD